MTYICYIDEAGNSASLPSGNTDNQPVLVIAGLIVQQDALSDITREFLGLKRKYFPGSFKSAHLLDDVREEIKGADLRSAIRKKAHKATTQLRFIDETLDLLESYECRILADIWVKGIGVEFKARETYTQSVQHACRSFQAFLDSKDGRGFMIADFRTTQLNDQVAHSIFTQKYRAKGDPFSRILELPTFGVSNNHVGLQITDVLCTALLFPMASSVYCFRHVTGVHVNARDLVVRRRYAKRVRNLQFRAGAYWSISVWDKLKKRTSAELFVVPPVPAASSAPVQRAIQPTVGQNAKQTARSTPVGSFGLLLQEVLKKGTAQTNNAVPSAIIPPADGPLPTDDADTRANPLR
ncbi:DUF3800 domain-containing protein [Trinickia dinghuensis]|uniref:DUF3800 domain-containing protein n=1 Tax=Trinickia dinghuensis TaxID=2291023 RepID=A0A3D8JRJ8_9BURK|nr:DUF3800 domain-containing protein [Trinickia dinghuensis]